MSSQDPLHQLEESSHLSTLEEFRNKALIANLWVILATITTGGILTAIFGNEGAKEAIVGFCIYFVSNSLALWAAYKKRHRLSLIGYTIQVFIVSTIAMILINDTPAHLVLAMVNFVLLHAVVLGRSTALTVTIVMVTLLLLVNFLGDSMAPTTAALVASGDLVLTMSDNTTLISLMTTTISTSYLIVTTIGLQERARSEVVTTNKLLSIAKLELQERMKKDQILSNLGAEAAAAASLDKLHTSLLNALNEGLPKYTHTLLSSSNEIQTDMSIGTGQQTLTLRTIPPLAPSDKSFTKNAILLIEGAQTRMNAEQRARETERLEGVGKLAASVAHDFNNLLVPITAVLELPTDNNDAHNSMRKAAKEATSQASALVKNLLTHACSLESTILPVDVCNVIRSSETLLRTFIKSNTVLQIDLPSSPAPVRADTVELEQIFLNTILNANEAIQTQGIIVVSVHINDDHIQIEVRDNGPGIPKEIQQWVLEPFHTTKPKGSGLGLATVNRIVQSYHGTLDLDSAVEGGACVRITLPSIHERLLPTTKTVQEKTNHHTYNILLIDDDPRVGHTIEMMLEKLGHQVDYLTDSTLVQDHIANGHHYDVVLTDYQMPHMTGAEIVQMLRTHNDHTPVIILSGYGAALDEHDGAQPNLVLSKPIQMKTLNSAIQNIFTKLT